MVASTHLNAMWRVVHDIHVIPIEDLVDHSESPDCVCGPTIEPEGDAFLVTHHSLDNREALEQA